MDVGGLDEGGSRLGRGTGRGAGYGSLGTGEAQVSLARSKPTNAARPSWEGGTLAAPFDAYSNTVIVTVFCDGMRTRGGDKKETTKEKERDRDR